MKRIAADRFLKELKVAFSMELLSDLKREITLTSYVEFNKYFQVTRTYSTTLCLGNGIYICINLEKNQMEIYNTRDTKHWFNWYDLKDYNKVELTLKAYSYLNKYNNN